MGSFTEAVERGVENERGWPSAAYAVSKSGIIGMTRAVAKEERKKGSGVLVNSCCPGYVSTDMTGNRGAKTVDEGAQTPVLLALGDIEGTSGEFVSYVLSLNPFLPAPVLYRRRICVTGHVACMSMLTHACVLVTRCYLEKGNR